MVEWCIIGQRWLDLFHRFTFLNTYRDFTCMYQGLCRGGGGGGGDTLYFSWYVGLDPASPVYPQKYQAYLKKHLKF